MKSLIKVEHGEDGTTISLAIKLSPSEAGKTMVNMSEGMMITADELVDQHKKYGIGVALALLRTYIWYCADTGYLNPQKKVRRKKKK